MPETSAQKRHRHYGHTCFRVECAQAPLVAPNGDKRCRCQEGLYNGLRGECIYCFGHPFAEWEWELLAPDNSAGFVETTDKEYPITIIAYRGKNKVTVSGIREDSVRAKADRDGNCNLSFEFADYPNRIGYIPCIDWYETECD